MLINKETAQDSSDLEYSPGPCPSLHGLVSKVTLR